jgi:geranylgeranyl transferase type-1 subunit beta
MIDIYHSYLGLAALAIMNEPGIKPLDSALCISMQQKDTIRQHHKITLVQTRTYWNHRFCFSIREDDPDFEKVMASSEKAPEYTGKSADEKSKIGEKVVVR